MSEEGYLTINEDIANKSWHKMTPEELSKILESDLNEGLTQETALRKLNIIGENCLYEDEPALNKILKHLFTKTTIFIYLVAIIAYFAYKQGFITSFIYHALPLIAFVISIITLIKSENEAKSIKLIESQIPHRSTAIRENKVIMISRQELVPGDIVIVKSGEIVPSDIRILYANEFKINIQCLTGSETILDRSEKCTSKDFLQAQNIAYFGSLCVQGECKGVIIHTGKNTLLSRLLHSN